jgi:phospholipid-binding lipoprotein MlaA
MRVLLSIVGWGVAIALAAMVSACASSGTSLPSADYVGTRDVADETRTPSSIPGPTDVASLPGDAGEVPDPYEKMNRRVFERNQRFNHAMVYPVAKAYHNNVPEGVRNSIENFASNLGEPFVFANDVLQLRLGAATATVGRFAMNSTVGIGGLFDPASKQKLEKQSGDFGQTLYVWGMRDSPYLVLPIIGPTNLRDFLGTTVEFAAAIPAGELLPTQIVETANNLTVAGSVASPFTKLGQIDQMAELEDSSIDFYSALRSVVEQKRQADLDEAFRTSGWTARYRAAPSATTTDPIVAAGSQATVPKTKEQEIVSNAFQSLN